jgi:hypothetical protein
MLTREQFARLGVIAAFAAIFLTCYGPILARALR